MVELLTHVPGLDQKPFGGPTCIAGLAIDCRAPFPSLVEDVAGASRRLRARLHLGEWREPISFEQLGDLQSRLARRAPVTLRSLLGG